MLHSRSNRFAPRRVPRLAAVAFLALCTVALASLIEMTMEDFHLSGTQVGEVSPHVIKTSDACIECHGPSSRRTHIEGEDATWSWQGSLMSHAARDPLFFAQLTTANQDVGNVGYYCLRCHAPMSFVSGHANDPSGRSLNDYDFDGVSCHFCHSMVDPDYKDGISPPEDRAILDGLVSVPEFYANAMFVLDPQGRRRGPREDAQPMHEFLPSPFHRSSNFCGTCHDVGNVAVSRQPDGSYRYNSIGEPTPDEDPWAQFPLERTFTEWKLSEFADGGVNMQGRFGGPGATVIETCQDCHMPRYPGRASRFGPWRPDVAQHHFAGSATWVLDIIAIYYRNDPIVNKQALAEAKSRSISMLQRAATLQVAREGDGLGVRVINETGHKLPTGHIEGRRVFLNVQFFNAAGRLIHEYGHYDPLTAHLDEASTRVYEMRVGLSAEAARITGLPPGVTTHMALADTIEFDNRIPPRGFTNARFEEGGAPVVGAAYADGQHWDDVSFPVPPKAAGAKVTLYYQTVTRHYIDVLREGNHTDHWGDTLYELWKQTGKGPPIEMAVETVRF